MKRYMMEAHPIYSVNCAGTWYWWSAPYTLGSLAILLVVLNVLAWGVVGLYEAVRVFV